MAWTGVHEELLKKINMEFDTYQGNMQGLCGSQVYAHAVEITAMNFCYNQLLSNFHDYQAEELAPLLQCERPLEMLRSRWMDEQNVDYSDEFEHVFHNMDFQEAGDEPEPGPSLC